MDSAVLGLASSGCDCNVLRVFEQDFALEDANEMRALSAPVCVTKGMPAGFGHSLTG
jgi:hypothetical protein